MYTVYWLELVIKTMHSHYAQSAAIINWDYVFSEM